jgi:phosphoribosylformylglycinamidine synthase
MADALTALGVPVVGGNVSLYNESGDGPIYPTPVVGMVGRLPDATRAAGIAFRQEGHEIALIGPFEPVLEGSELEKRWGRTADGLPQIDLAAQARALAVVREAVRGGKLASAHDVSDGGLACAVAECCVAGGVGARVEWDATGIERLPLPAPSDVRLFGEAPGGVVVSGPAAAIAELADAAADTPVLTLGTVGGNTLDMRVFAARLRVAVDDLTTAREGTLPDLLS